MASARFVFARTARAYGVAHGSDGHPVQLLCARGCGSGAPCGWAGDGVALVGSRGPLLPGCGAIASRFLVQTFGAAGRFWQEYPDARFRLKEVMVLVGPGELAVPLPR
jgi:hypothetical protein